MFIIFAAIGFVVGMISLALGIYWFVGTAMCDQLIDVLDSDDE